MSNESVTTHTLNTEDVNKPQTATRIPKKRGRKGDKIVRAFENIPTTPVDLEEYAVKYNISINTLKQDKRHDRFKERGKVYVRKNKQTKRMEIWRDPTQKP